MSDETRTESDSLGDVTVPADAYYGAQTERARRNFPISDSRFPRPFIRAIGLVKWSAARANEELGLLDEGKSEAIREAARDVIDGNLDDQFVVDIFQTGSGTSTNMNANEVIGNRAIEIMGGELGSREPVHPNDHVNMGQSSNDVIPTSIHVAAVESIQRDLIPALESLRDGLREKAEQFDDVVKTGRTHLQDATPVRLGQEFSGYASQIDHGIRRVENALEELRELAIGGTAVGTGLNRHPKFPKTLIGYLNEETGENFREADNHFEAQGGRDALVSASGAMKTIATSLMKIANDIRWGSSGPRAGLGELEIDPVQPGSSIMPGKINPVISESVCQVAAQVIGNDAAVTTGGQAGNFELNVMKPVMAHNLLESISLLARASSNFQEKCIDSLEANEEHCEEMVERALALCTALAPHIGYDRASELSKKAFKEDKTIREVCLEEDVMDEDELDEVLDPASMTEPGIPG
jgi:fumarate hydratase class II